MLGVNEIKSEEDIPSPIIISLCEGLLAQMEEPDMRRMRRSDPDRYFRTLASQFKRLNDRLPGIFNLLVQYGRRTPDGTDTMAKITWMLQLNDQKKAGTITSDDADKAVDYEFAHRYVRPALGEAEFDRIVSNPASTDEKSSA